MNDDEPWEDLFAKLREIEPPANVRAGNRAAVRAAAGAAAPPRAMAGWRSWSVTTPVPAALGIAALLLASLTLNVVLWRGQRTPFEAPSSIDAKGAANPAVERRSRSTTHLAMNAPQLEYSETQFYVSGVGVVDRQASYQFQVLP